MIIHFCSLASDFHTSFLSLANCIPHPTRTKPSFQRFPRRVRSSKFSGAGPEIRPTTLNSTFSTSMVILAFSPLPPSSTLRSASLTRSSPSSLSTLHQPLLRHCSNSPSSVIYPTPYSHPSSFSLFICYSSSCYCANLFFLQLLNPRIYRTTGGRLLCRAELPQDAPFAAAIGACMLSSLLLPAATPPSDEESDSGLDTTDARLTVMGIISFVPYFNWLSWVFAWLDTGKRRYAVYALVYLAPYIRSNLSLFPEDSWLPIASIFLGVIHVQLEASIKNGDIQGFQLFSEVSKLLSLTKDEIEDDIMDPERLSEGKKGHGNLPSDIGRKRDAKKKPSSEHHKHSNGDWD
ncbi:hypothetical protein LINPERHAP2_LOCUS33392 [Linum perenne]